LRAREQRAVGERGQLVGAPPARREPGAVLLPRAPHALGRWAAVSAAPTVEVLIPHHNRIDSLPATLDSLRRQPAPASVCVVDNASTDGSREVLAAEYPEVRVVALERNYGFGAALNRGARESEADLLVFLNNDAVADERFVERVRDRFAATGAEMVAACLRAPSGEVESLGVELDRSLNPYDAAHGAAF